MDIHDWEKISGRSEDHWLELRETQESPFWEAIVKWDGCIDLSHAGNVPFDDYYGHSWSNRVEPPACDDSFHICDLDELIARLQSLKAAALEHFGPGWPRDTIGLVRREDIPEGPGAGDPRGRPTP